MSFRRYGGLNYAPKNNIMASNYNSVNNLSVSEGVGQANSYINFLSDISGNINIYGNIDISGNLHVSGDIDCSGNENIDGNLHVSGDIDCSGNENIDGNIDCSGNITSYYMFLSSGTNYTDQLNGVVPKSYVDAIISGVHPLPKSRCISTSPITLSGLQTIDGYNVQNGDYVLVNGQSGENPNVNNGQYIASSGPWSRSSFLDDNSDAAGTLTFISNGQQYANTRWVCLTPSPATIGTVAVFWTEFDSPFNIGRGLEVINPNTKPTIVVDTSLNFIQYLDNQGPDGAGTINIGTNTNNINIGNTNSITNVDGSFNVIKNLNIGVYHPQPPDDLNYPYVPLLVNANVNQDFRNNGIHLFNSNDASNNHAIMSIRTYLRSNQGNPMLYFGVNQVPGDPSTYTVGINSVDDSFRICESIVDMNTNTRFYIAPNTGNIGIGTNEPNYLLDVNGEVNASAYNNPSDYRIKENIVSLNEKYIVDNLRPVTYFNTKLDKQDVGLIAHELQEIYPELVTGEKDGENLQSVNYTGLIPILIKEIQDLKKNNIELTNQLLDLKKVVETLIE